MAGWLLGIVALIYLGVAVSYWLQDDRGMALAFAAYSLANVGFILAK